MPGSPFQGVKAIMCITVDKKLTCFISCNTLTIKRQDQIIKLRGLDMEEWKLRLEMTRNTQ